MSQIIHIARIAQTIYCHSLKVVGIPNDNTKNRIL